MLKKLSVAALVLGLAYVGGSYYVGVRAEQQLLAVMNDAQIRTNNELAWERVDTQHGIFTSSGSMVLVLKQLTVDDSTPVQTRIAYTIHHHLLWSRLAHFVWSVTPDEAIAKKLQPLYEQTPSLTGDGMLDWSGVAKSTIAFPGIDRAAANNGTLNVAPLVGNLTVGENAFDLTLGVTELTFVDLSSPERVQLKNLRYESRSDDVANGSVALALAVGDAMVIAADGAANTMTDYRWHVDIDYQNDLLSVDSQKTIAAATAMGHQATNVEISLGMAGLHRNDLEALADLVDEVDDQWLELSDAQQTRAEQLFLSMLKRGLSLSVPAIKADIQLMGADSAQTVGIEDFRFKAQASDPAQGAGQVQISLGALKVPTLLQWFVPQVQGFEFEIANTVVDGRTDLQIKKSLARLSFARLDQAEQSVRDVAFQARLKGLTPQGLFAFIDMAREVDGDMAELSPEQQAQLALILQEAAAGGLSFSMPVLKGMLVADTNESGASETEKGEADSIVLEGLDLQIKLDDAATGAGSASLMLGKLFANGPQMADVPNITNYRLTVNNQVIDGKVDYQLDKSIEALDAQTVKLGPSALAMRLTGLSALDLQRLSELAPAFEEGLDQAQAAELAQIVRRAIASGFVLAVPRLQLAIDGANLNAQGQVDLQGLGQAPLASFDLARLANMQAELEVTGQSPSLLPFVQQGLMMGLLASDGDVVKGQYQFSNGQFLLNGMAVPAGEFIAMANLMVQQMLAQASSGQQDLDAPLSTPRQRRGPSN